MTTFRKRWQAPGIATIRDDGGAVMGMSAVMGGAVMGGDLSSLNGALTSAYGPPITAPIGVAAGGILGGAVMGGAVMGGAAGGGLLSGAYGPPPATAQLPAAPPAAVTGAPLPGLGDAFWASAASGADLPLPTPADLPLPTPALAPTASLPLSLPLSQGPLSQGPSPALPGTALPGTALPLPTDPYHPNHPNHPNNPTPLEARGGDSLALLALIAQ